MTVEPITARDVFDGDPPLSGPRKVIQIEAESPGRTTRARTAAIALAAMGILAALGWWWARPPLVEETLWIGKVQSGDLRAGVGGHGRLVPSGLLTLSSTTGGAVAEIHALPGARLRQGDAIVTLTNPELLTDLRTAEKGYSEKEAERAALLEDLVTSRAAKRAVFGDAEDGLALDLLDLEVQSKLFEGGIISRIQLEKQRARVAAARRRVAQAAADLENLEMSHRIRTRVVDAAVQNAQAELDLVRRRVGELTIRAAQPGTLHELMENVTVGTPVAAGAVFATIATREHVSAELQVPSSRSAELVIGQLVELQAGDRFVTGRVQRIDPRVQQDQVRVSVTLNDQRGGLLPGQAVSGEIVTRRLRNVVYVERPAGVADHQTMKVFAVDRAGSRLRRHDVRFGKTGGRYIAVDSGLKPGMEVVLSDMTRFASHSSLRYDRGDVR